MPATSIKSATRTATRPDAPRAALGWAAAWTLLGAALIGSWAAGPGLAPGAAHRPARAAATAPSTTPRTKAIEQVVAGDLVLARDERTGHQEPRRVVRTYRRTSDHLRVLGVRSADGRSQELRTTDEHPFWVEGTGWVAAGKLAVGQRLSQSDLGRATVESTRREARPGGVAVYNFQVEDFHSYFVAECSNLKPILVHNANSHAYRLEGDMVNAGLGAKPTGYATHHIVPEYHPQGAPAREVLHSVGMDINTHPNGVYLPHGNTPATGTVTHHTATYDHSYYDEVNRRLTSIPTPTPEIVRDALGEIRSDLINGTFFP